MSNFLVFAGTSEGRRLVELLHESGALVCASVATEYGKILLPEGVRVFAERLEAEEMATLMQSLNFDCVIDATHPHASQVTENIKAACAFADVRYLRLVRPSGEVGDCVYVENAQKAAEVISAVTGKVLLTTGSKELELFTSVPNFEERLYPRVLPVEESLRHCIGCGYPIAHIIAMQGPFTRELNCAMMRQIGASVLVTKESGDSGGFGEKLMAAQDVGATVVVIGRPKEDSGLLFAELAELLARDYELSLPLPGAREQKYCPIFINMAALKIVVVGGNLNAARVVKDLLQFATRVCAIAAQFDPAFDELDVIRIERPYMQGDCLGNHLVFAATDHPEINSAVLQEAKHAGIPVCSTELPEECDFVFAQVVRQDGFVAGVLDVTGQNRRAKSLS